MKDPYDVLGVSRNASEADIKAAFRRLGREHHPDRNPDDDEAAQRFKEINAAYQILSDPQKRAVFDRFGAAGLGGGGRAPGPFDGMPFDFSEIPVDGIFADLLDALGIRVGDRGDVQVELEIGFEEAAFGCTKRVTYDRVTRCATCDGSGAASDAGVATCPSCNGRGRLRIQQGVLPIAVERTCPRCNGRGGVVLDPCTACAGVGLKSSRDEIELEIPPGIEAGASRRIAGRGNAGKGRRPGDLEVVIRVRPHELFRRSGNNVVCRLPITFAQAVLGSEIDIPTLDGRGVLRIPSGTQPGSVLRIRGKGIPRRAGGRGDQLVEIQVEIPTNLTDGQKELVQQLANELGEAVQPARRTFMEKLKDLFS